VAAKNEPLVGSDEPLFEISRVFHAPRALVFKAWTEPGHLVQWWGPRGVVNPVCEMDVRVGGAYRIVMRMPNGVEYPISGVFEEIVPPARFVMTQDCAEHPKAWHDMVKPNRAASETNPAGVLHTTVTFDDLGGKTRVTVRTRFESAAIRDAMVKMGMRQGWGQSLDRLAEHLKTSVATDRELINSRIVDAPAELVWKAMTEAKNVVNWWGPVGFSTTIKQMDVRPGGVWEHVMHGPDGTDYPNRSVFKEVVEPHRLAYSCSGSKVGGPGVEFESTWTFEPVEGDAGEERARTQVTIYIVFATAEEREMVCRVYGAAEGGRQTLGRLAEFVGKGG
jgi:uncharacterized protein YndB with AHSA1/START domain